MKTKLIIISIFLTAIIVGITVFSSTNEKAEVQFIKHKKTASQYLILLDLSDRIAEPGQIETDKKIIENLFQDFKKVVFNHLAMNSKDRFQICIAPQKEMGFDKYFESENLTLDLSKLKPAERVKKLTDFENNLTIKINSLYQKAYKGTNSKSYEGSNIWQYFNEELPDLTAENYNTNLIVLTDGYFDFEKGNAEIKNEKGSTTTSFINNLRKKDNWKEIIQKENYRLLPINNDFKNLKICVAEIRSKDQNNLNETDIIKYVWADWLKNSQIDTNSYITVAHGSVSNSQTKIHNFLN